MSSPRIKKKDKVLPSTLLEEIAGRFAVLSEPMRLRILHSLMEGEANVSSLVERLDAGQANISRHLQALLRGGFVYRRKEGLKVFYGIADRGVFDLCEIVCGQLETEISARARALAVKSTGGRPKPY